MSDFVPPGYMSLIEAHHQLTEALFPEEMAASRLTAADLTAYQAYNAAQALRSKLDRRRRDAEKRKTAPPARVASPTRAGRMEQAKPDPNPDGSPSAAEVQSLRAYVSRAGEMTAERAASIAARAVQAQACSDKAWSFLRGHLFLGSIQAYGVTNSSGLLPIPPEYWVGSQTDSPPGTLPISISGTHKRVSGRPLLKEFDLRSLMTGTTPPAQPERQPDDVTSAQACGSTNATPRTQRRSRRRLAAEEIIKREYPNGVPEGVTNKDLVIRVQKAVPKGEKMLEEDTILRAAGRRTDTRKTRI